MFEQLYATLDTALSTVPNKKGSTRKAATDSRRREGFTGRIVCRMMRIDETGRSRLGLDGLYGKQIVVHECLPLVSK
jgi:hypothetical protein